MRKYGWILAYIAFVLLMVPFYLGITGAHPATDDFTFAAYTRPTFVRTGSILHVIKDALSYTLRTWRDWQGTITGVFIMALNPAVFSIRHYGIHAVILLSLYLLAMAVFLHHFVAKRLGMGKIWRIFYLVLGASSLVFLPDMVEGIYWFNGAWFYTGAQACALLTLVLCDLVMQEKRKGVLRTVFCAGMLFALGMDNYITAMMCLLGTLLLAILRICGAPEKERKGALRALIMVLPVAAGLAISVMAPGNKVRMATDGAYQGGPVWMAVSILKTLWAGGFYTARFLFKTPLLSFLLAMVPVLRKRENNSGKGISPVIVILAYFLILWGMLFPHIYSSGYAGSGRVINMYHDYVLLALPLVLCLCLRGKEQVPGTARVWGGLSALALILCLILGQQNNYVKLVTDQLTGVQAAYIHQFQNEYAILEAAEPGTDVVVPAWTVQTVTGKPTIYEDPTVWTNESVAGYFGVRSVRAEPAKTPE